MLLIGKITKIQKVYKIQDNMLCHAVVHDAELIISLPVMLKFVPFAYLQHAPLTV